MGTVGINFGTASSGQGFDVASTVTAILANQQAIESPWKNQLSSLQAQDTVLSTLGTDLSTLTNDLQALTDFNGVLSQKQGAISNPNVLSITSATNDATAGNHTVVVNQLAQTSSDYSDTISGSDTLSGSITIQGQTITVDDSSNTLSSLATAINKANIGVTASVLTDSSGSRLSLVSETGGAAGQLTISSNLTDTTNSGASIGFHTGLQGQDASLVVDGVSLTSNSNTVTDAIPGVTLQLLSTTNNATSTAPDGSTITTPSPVQVQITNDTQAVGTAISTILSDYNAVVKDLNTQEGKDSSGNPEPLSGNPLIASLQSQLTSALLGGTPSGSISSLTQLGIGFNSDGTLTLDGDTLNNALNNDYSDVVGFLQNSGSFGQTFLSTLNNLGSQAPHGIVYLAQQENSAQESALNDSINNEEALLATEKTNLTTELNTANQVLQSIPSQLDEINEMYSAITGYNTGNG